MKKIGNLELFVNIKNDVEITPEKLIELSFEQVLTNDYKLVEPIEKMNECYSTVYVRFCEDGTALLEASNIFGTVKIGNYYLEQSATLRDLLKVVKLLHI